MKATPVSKAKRARRRGRATSVPNTPKNPAEHASQVKDTMTFNKTRPESMLAKSLVAMEITGTMKEMNSINTKAGKAAKGAEGG